jgi:thiol-disulfide isomerase/thioredoxin
MTRTRFATALLAAALVAAPVRAAAPQGKSLPATMAPSATVQTLDGRNAQLADIVAGKPSVLIFWASWCPSCRQQVPSYKAAHARFRGTALQFVTVNAGIRDTLESVRGYVKENDLPYLVLFDTEQEALSAYRVSGTPTALLLNAGGEIVSRAHAVDPEAIEALLAGKPIPRSEPPPGTRGGSGSR